MSSQLDHRLEVTRRLLASDCSRPYSQRAVIAARIRPRRGLATGAEAGRCAGMAPRGLRRARLGARFLLTPWSCQRRLEPTGVGAPALGETVAFKHPWLSRRIGSRTGRRRLYSDSRQTSRRPARGGGFGNRIGRLRESGLWFWGLGRWVLPEQRHRQKRPLSIRRRHRGLNPNKNYRE